MPRERPTAADRADWARFAEDIRPLPGRPRPAPPPASMTAAPVTAAPVTAAPVAATPGADKIPAPRPAPRRTEAPVAVGTAPPGLDKASWRRFRSGALAPTRVLDLHAHTAQRAWQALRAFLTAAVADGLRCVEVVTGRGSGETGGVLKREVPHWLNGPELRPLVLAVAHPHPANPGSLRVLLRRTRADQAGSTSVARHRYQAAKDR